MMYIHSLAPKSPRVRFHEMYRDKVSGVPWHYYTTPEDVDLDFLYDDRDALRIIADIVFDVIFPPDRPQSKRTALTSIGGIYTPDEKNLKLLQLVAQKALFEGSEEFVVYPARISEDRNVPIRAWYNAYQERKSEDVGAHDLREVGERGRKIYIFDDQFFSGRTLHRAMFHAKLMGVPVAGAITLLSSSDRERRSGFRKLFAQKYGIPLLSVTIPERMLTLATRVS